MQHTRNRGMSLGIQGNNGSENITSSQTSTFSDNHGYNLAYQHEQSIAKQTLQRYGSGSSHYTPRQNRAKIETKTHPTTGLQHPFDKERKFLSWFPLGFRGCYNCGKQDHYSTRDFPAAQSVNFKKVFF